MVPQGREPVLWTDDINVARAFVLAGGGESLNTLILGDGMKFMALIWTMNFAELVLI